MGVENLSQNDTFGIFNLGVEACQMLRFHRSKVCFSS
nr:MAG TPA: hypothetical protein [Caudoviricetes sp.]